MLFIWSRMFLPRAIRTGSFSCRLERPCRLERFARLRLLAAACVAVFAVMISACNSSSSGSKAKAGPISVTSPTGGTGQVSLLALASSVKVSMMPTGDAIGAGVDWSVTCGGNPVTGSVTNGACGTLVPTHTANGAATIFTAPSAIPLGNSVTITGTVTSNPSQSSSVSLTILSAPITVEFGRTPQGSVVANGVATFTAEVTNDPTNAGVIWTVACASSVCGSFNPATTQPDYNVTYTAPSVVPDGGTVTITATSLTDTSKSVSATVAITAPTTGPILPISISASPATVYAQTSGPAHTVQMSATVVNDPAQAGVDWTVNCGSTSCGNMVPAHSASGAAVKYTGPSAVPQGGTVTITAKSTTDPTKSATITATIVTTTTNAVTISTAPPATLSVGSQATMAATVAPNTGAAGVNWAATCGSAGACGSFNLTPAHTASGGQIVYTAPATPPDGNVVTITASFAGTTNSNPAVAAITINAPPVISFNTAPPTTLTATSQAPVSATVLNDVAPEGVSWSVQCGSTVAGACGWIAPPQTADGATATYTAPPVTTAGTSVTITATSIADPSVSITSSPITITPSTKLSIEFLPMAPSQVSTNSTVNLAAAVTNDSTNAGVDWQVCPSGCGFFTIEPAVPAITTGTTIIPAVPAVTATTVTGWPNNRPLPYTAPTQPPDFGSVVILAVSHASPATATSANVAISTEPGNSALHGTVQAGTQPVVGASVALYAAGTSGYASAASQIAVAPVTGKDGSFTVPAYNCPQLNSQMYLVATGGQVGSNSANPNLSLMTALGSCGGLGSGPVVVNEVTTIASAYATSPFAANDALTGNSSYTYLGASSSNAAGIANAFAAVSNLIDLSTGQARFVVPSGNAVVPYVEINTLADMLHACVASSGGAEGDGSSCSLLFVATDLLGTGAFNGSVAPSDTLQAAFNIAQHPIGNNYGYRLDKDSGGTQGSFFSLATSNSPFQPILTKNPPDWSISLQYASGGGLSDTSTVGSFAVDATGNLWITDTAAGSVIEWTGVGAALSPSTGFPAGGGPIAIDAMGNVWISGDSSLTELTALGTPVLGSPFLGVPGGGNDIAIDALGNLWISDSGGVNEFSSLGERISPIGGFTNQAITNITTLAMDSASNVWVGTGPGTNSSGNVAELANPGAQLIVEGGAGSAVLPQTAADGSGNIWVETLGDLYKVPPYAGRGATLNYSTYPTGGTSSVYSNLDLENPGGIAIDGAGIVWAPNAGDASTPGGIVPAGLLPVDTNSAWSSAVSYYSAALTVGTRRAAVDGSGNVWVLLSDNTMVEYVGVAVPVVDPIALGVQKNKLGAKP